MVTSGYCSLLNGYCSFPLLVWTHAILQLANQIHESFENNLYTSGVFIDLSKAFDTVSHSIILKKLEIYGIHGKTLSGLKVI